MISSRRFRAVGLFSGGLDSVLATRLMSEQNASVVGLHFRLPFMPPGRVASDERLRRLAEIAGASLVSVDVEDDYIRLVESPPNGYSVHMAPCVDCMAYMVSRARELAREIKAEVVFTGEVLGQRSPSQSKRSLKLIEKAAGVTGRLLRPLCAKLLEPTLPELSGLVRRERLLDFCGHGRRQQIRLAHEFGLIDYPSPGNGCLLCDLSFAVRCRDAIAHGGLTRADIELLKYGRHFRLESGAKVVVGRNQTENVHIQKLAVAGDLVCHPENVMGPVVLLRAKRITKKDTQTAARICARYCDGPPGETVSIVCADRTLAVRPVSKEEVESLQVKPGPRESSVEPRVEKEVVSG